MVRGRCAHGRVKDRRDRALLLIGFAGGLRRSELAVINFVDFERGRSDHPAIEDRSGRRGAQGRHPVRPNHSLPRQGA